MNIRRITVAMVMAVLDGSFAVADHTPGIFDAPWLGFDLGNYEQAGYPQAAALGDFDGDGDLDAAVATTTNFAEVSVILNNGDGMFGEPTLYPLARASRDIVSGDFDGDGDVDLIAAASGVNWEGQTVSLFRNNGDGTFLPQQQFSVGSPGPEGLAAADFDRDGDLDLVVARYGFLGQGNTIALLRNNGVGLFAAPEVFPAGASPNMLDAADLNGDTYPDLAVAADGAVRVLFNTAGTGFAGPVTYDIPGLQQAGIYPAITAADVDRDGDTDLLYGNALLHAAPDSNSPYAVALYRNDGGGTFAAPESIPLGAYTGSFVSIAVADITGDLWPDIFGTHQSNGGWSVIPSTGSGQFGSHTTYIPGEYPFGMLAADIDNDGDIDPVIVNAYSINLSVHFNPGNGIFGVAQYPIASVFSEIDLADVDADGDIDIGVAYFNLLDGEGVQIVKNDGSGAFAPAFTYPHPSLEFFDPHFADLTADGLPDLIYAHWDTAPPYTFRWRINQGNGALGPEFVGPVATCGTSDIQTGDLDNDGDVDVVMTEWLGCVNIPTSARRVFIVENVGTPQSPAFALDEIIVVAPGPGGVTIGDFNHDAIPDLAVTSQPINVLIGLGDLNYSVVQLSQVPSIPITHADFNADGHLDLAVGIVENTSFSPGLGIMLGQGHGTFQPVVQYPGSYSPDLGQIQEIAALDADDDGDADVLAVNYASNDISFWANNGDGTFARQVRYGVGLGSPGDLGVADLNGDGIADLAVPAGIIPGFLGRVAILPGQVRGEPPVPGDIDGDGDVDISDLTLLLSAFGSCTGDAAFNAAADIDADGCIDLGDLTVLLASFGS